MRDAFVAIAAIIAGAQPLSRPDIPARVSAPKDQVRGRKAASIDASPVAATEAAPADGDAPRDLPNVSQPPADVAPGAAPTPTAAADQSVENKPSQVGASPAKSDRRRGAGRRATQRRDRGAPIEDVAALDRRLAFFPQTDLGNAERFRERQRGRFLWCAALGWLWWDGRRWNREGADARVNMAVHDCVRSIQDEAEAIAGSDFDKIGSKVVKGEEVDIFLSDLLRAWGRASEANNRLVPISKHAAAYLSVETHQLDADPFAINVANGTLVIRRTDDPDADYVSFFEHDPLDLITKIAPVTFDPDATCARFEQFLFEVQPAADTRAFLQQWKGLSLTGDVSEQKLCVFWGKGKNGKSVFEDVTATVLGDYSKSVAIETFLDQGRGRRGDQASPDLARLPGVRSLRTSEPKKGAMLDEALIKLATGGEEITARHLNKEFFDFYPRFKLTISGNYRPKIAGADEGIWRRVNLVPWTVTIPEEKRDMKLTEKLSAERSGILNWMLDGLRDWLDRGLVSPDEVKEATSEYRRDSDQLGRFLEACVVASPGDRVQSTVLHGTFVAWSRANSATEWKGKGFSDAMTERGFKKTKSSEVFFLDIKLVRFAHDFVDHEGKPRTQGAKTPLEGAIVDDIDF